MLEISNITKDYKLKDQVVPALKGINIVFRRSEFVAILGPSGCGKTTLLNIIGGLDRYTSGDLIIDGKSTKKFKDRDWDDYRNRRVGFVFQSYNLIPHQTVLENVELALTLSGIKRAERRKRAIEVLNKVGLGDKLKSKPNQLSGGQMQRVAIARALVNNPEIILADEPTGALDSKTSVQIMEILKEVSKDKLVVMVTHNPDLANQYSSRIIRLLDGELIEDSKPYKKAQADREIANHSAKLDEQKNKKQKRAKMSIFTAMFLSFRNLLTKKGRTVLVALAGSIGIIGIALILAVSSGMTNYINNMQSESLSSYPVSITSVSINFDEVTTALTTDDDTKGNKDEIAVYDLKKTLKDFGDYNYISKEFIDYVNNYYSNENKAKLLNDRTISYASDTMLISQNYLPVVSKITYSALSGTTNATFFEGLNNKDYVLSTYDLYGDYPTEKNEIALVLNSGSIDSSSLQSYGFIVPGLTDEKTYLPVKYSEIVGTKYKLLLNNGYYAAGSETTSFDWSALKFDEANAMASMAKIAQFYNSLTPDAEDDKYVELTISGVLSLKDGASGSLFSNGLMYTPALAKFYHENCQNSDVVNVVKQKYFVGENFNEEKAEEAFVKDYVLSINELATFQSLLPGGIDKNAYTYTTPKQMKDTLKEYFGYDFTYEEIMDLYLQVYGASNVPVGMSFYVKSFDAKDDLIKMINTWNEKEGVYKINFADSSSMLTNMLKSVVNIISYVLIAFAAISLVVSSIMISIITYTSVIERTKEIGVLRSIGASKGDVSNVFNAETILIGLMAGIIGVGVSALLTIPISLILKGFTGISGLAVLQPLPCLILVLISVVLTFLAGLIPARIASKKDPVLALRSE